MTMPPSLPRASWNGMVASIVPERTAPPIRPNVRTIFFMVLGLLGGRGGKAPASCALSSRLRVTRTGDFPVRGAEITRSGDQSGLFRPLDRLRATLRVELAEQPGRVRLHRVLAHEQPLADLLVAQAGRQGLQNVQLARGDSEGFDPGLVAD